jgi:hypothetical protein
MQRSNTAIQFSHNLDKYIWESQYPDDAIASATTVATLPPPQYAHRLSDSAGLAAPVHPTQTPSQSFSPVPPKAAMAIPRSDRRFDHSRVVHPSTIHGVVPAARVAEMTRRIDNLNRPAIRSPAQLPPTAPRHAPHLSVVDRPSGIADRPSPTVDRPQAHAATTRHRSDPYHLVQDNQRVAPAQSTIDPNADYTEEWRSYRVYLDRDKRWWEWERGIIDLRALFPTSRTAVAGTQLNVGFDACAWVLRRHPCEFKIGMARTLGSRWELYRSSSATWTPSHLFIVLHVRGRDAVGFAEAGLIGMLYACGEYDDDLNMNHRNNDRGGSGPRHECELDDWFWVYLATMSVS